MGFQALLFYALAAVLLTAAVATVTLRCMVRAALCLILAFFTAAMLWMLLHAEFLSILLVLVYIGAVLVLFLFVVMMVERETPAEQRAPFRLSAALVALLMIAELLAVLGSEDFGPAQEVPSTIGSNTQALGAVLYTEYALAFEAAAVALLIAIVGAIALTLRERGEQHRQKPSEQTQASKQERLRLTDGRTEPPC